MNQCTKSMHALFLYFLGNWKSSYYIAVYYVVSVFRLLCTTVKHYYFKDCDRFAIHGDVKGSQGKIAEVFYNYGKSYKIQFDVKSIKELEIEEWRNIFHLTTSNECGEKGQCCQMIVGQIATKIFKYCHQTLGSSPTLLPNCSVQPIFSDFYLIVRFALHFGILHL